MGKASRSKRAGSARERIAAQRAKQRAAERRRRIAWYGGGGAVVIVIVIVVAVFAATRSTGSSQVLPPGVGGGTPDAQPAALTVANPTSIRGVTAYDTTGWPASSHNGPAARALSHKHVSGPVRYSVTPPVGGDHNAQWMNCGVYTKPVPPERAVHNLEHGAVWITYQPSLPSSEVDQLVSFFKRQATVGQTRSRYIDVTPYPGLPSPIVASSWGFQLRLSSPSDPRLQQFVNKFRVSRQYTPEYGAACTGGLGIPAQK
jgi:Protein of unknown function (DUF3105)